MLTLAPVDSFYVGFFEPHSVVRMTYVFDGGRVLGPDMVPYGPHGLSAHVRAGHTYSWSQDAGALVQRGLSFGDIERVSHDAVVTPIRDDVGPPLGLIGYLSYQPSVFSSELVAAAEWLADAFAVTEKWSRSYHLRIDHAAITGPQIELTPAEALLQVRKKLAQLSDRMSTLRTEQRITVGDLDELIALCEQATTSALQARDESACVGTNFSILTDREREVAFLVREGRTNAQICSSLHLSESTVKGHVTHILAKLGLQNRTQI
ncbi:helix-turn-helix transcriptional regulator [Flexivirga meconopsidis]|uniref:helix-turn-helix transcriptional regulator n=1 Tax=Flexivirga meconopsidis TaxID=2977121 RepID=UPI0022403003|nr:LuxR family transcriptional regulator [Flexivirga meconopsidis]